MKVAILVPEAKALSNGSDSRYAFGNRISEALRDTVNDMTLYPIPIYDPHDLSASFTTLHALYTFFTKAEGFDLIHNLIGLLPLFLNPTPITPILTTFLNPLSKEETAFIQTFHPLFFFSSIESNTSLENANFLGTFNASEMLTKIPELYKKILALTQREDHRPWGYYVILADNPDHKVKRIVVRPLKRLSLQRHQRRSEHWHIIRGEAVVTLDDMTIPLKAGESVDIPKGAAHRIENPDSANELAFIEVQRGDYFGEDDIERLEDDYGRA